MRICYERTVGGPGHPDNPIGVGFTGGQPNILYADGARASEPASFGPLAAAWPVRRSRLHGHEPFVLSGAPVNLPDDLDWGYFQAAPADQRLAELPERAFLLLEGLHPEHASLRMRLPNLHATARLLSRSQPAVTQGMRADTIVVDGESQSCTVTWRGTFTLPSAAVLPDLVVVAAGVHAPGQALAWPVMPGEHRPPAPSSAAAPASGQQPRPAKKGATMALDVKSLKAALPFVSPGSAPPAPVEDTVDQAPSPIHAAVLPFAGLPHPPEALPHASPAPSIAGAPWSHVPVAHPDLEAADDGGTMLIRSPLRGGANVPVAPPPIVAPPPLVAPPPPVAAPPPVAPPPAVQAPPVQAPPVQAAPPAPAPTAPPAHPTWRVDEPAPAPAPQPAPPAPKPGPDVRQHMYGAFTRKKK
jgi:hypothetical protein